MGKWVSTPTLTLTRTRDPQTSTPSTQPSCDYVLGTGRSFFVLVFGVGPLGVTLGTAIYFVVRSILSHMEFRGQFPLNYSPTGMLGTLHMEIPPRRIFCETSRWASRLFSERSSGNSSPRFPPLSFPLNFPLNFPLILGEEFWELLSEIPPVELPVELPVGLPVYSRRGVLRTPLRDSPR